MNRYEEYKRKSKGARLFRLRHRFKLQQRGEQPQDSSRRYSISVPQNDDEHIHFHDLQEVAPQREQHLVQ